MSDGGDLMRRTESLLRDLTSHLGNQHPTTSTVTTKTASSPWEAHPQVPLTPTASALPRPPQSQNASPAFQEFRRRFPGMNSGQTHQPLAKRRKTTQGYLPPGYVPKDTWTHDFCVLGKVDEDLTPTRSRGNVLSDAGLGRARLSLNKMASHQELIRAIEEHYPKLRNGGGIEVLRSDAGGGGQRKLQLVHPGPFGYSVPFLKDRLGQAVAYVRPLQLSLDESCVRQESAQLPKIPCLNCGMKINMTDIKEHQQLCEGGSSSSNQENATIIDLSADDNSKQD